MPEDKIKALYSAVSADYDVGSENDFRTKLADPEKRKAFYDGVGAEYQLGSFDEFDAKVGTPEVKKKQTSTPSFGYATAGEAVGATAKSPSSSTKEIKIGKVGDTKLPTPGLSGDMPIEAAILEKQLNKIPKTSRLTQYENATKNIVGRLEQKGQNLEQMKTGLDEQAALVEQGQLPAEEYNKNIALYKDANADFLQDHKRLGIMQKGYEAITEIQGALTAEEKQAAKDKYSGFTGGIQEKMDALAVGIPQVASMASGFIPYAVRNAVSLSTGGPAPVKELMADQIINETGLGKLEDSAQDYAKIAAVKSEEINAAYDKGIIESLAKGDIAAASGQATNKFLESFLPSMAAMTNPALGIPAFGSQKYYSELKDRDDLTEDQKLTISNLNGALEFAFEKVGTAGIVKSTLKNIAAKEGKEGTQKYVSSFLQKALTDGFGKYTPLTAPVQGFISEYSTSVSQDIVNNLLDPKSDLSWEEINKKGTEAGAIGMVGDALVASPGIPNLFSSKAKVQADEIGAKLTEIDQQMQEVPEPVKEVLLDEKQKLTETLNKSIVEDKVKLEIIPIEQQQVIQDNSSKIDELKENLADPTLTEETKTIVENRINELQTEIDDIYKTAEKQTPEITTEPETEKGAGVQDGQEEVKETKVEDSSLSGEDVNQKVIISDGFGEIEKPETEAWKQKVIEALQETDGDANAAFERAGFADNNGIWVHPAAQEMFKKLTPETIAILKENGVGHISASNDYRSANEEGRALTIRSNDGRMIRGVDINIGGTNKFNPNHIALHEVAHVIWEEKLTEEQRDVFANETPVSEYAQRVKDSRTKGAPLSDALHDEEDFAELFSKNNGDVEAAIIEAKRQAEKEKRPLKIKKTTSSNGGIKQDGKTKDETQIGTKEAEMLTPEEQPEEKSMAVLSDEEKANLEKVGDEVGENFRIIQNIYNKYGEGKPLTEITAEDYKKAEDKRDTVKKEADGKKKALLNRAHEGANTEDVKSAIEKHGLNYEPESHEKAKASAKSLIQDIGAEKALDAVRKNKIEDGAAAFVWAEIIDDIGSKIATETDENEIKKLQELEAELISEFDRKARSGGRFISALSDIYKNSTFGYKASTQIEKYKSTNGGEISAEVEKRFRELEKELTEVQKRLKEVEEKEAQAEIIESIGSITEGAVRSVPKKNTKEEGKKLADKIRKAKITPPSSFLAANPAILVWDGAVEAVAKAVEAGSAIADAIQKGIEHIKQSEWYNTAEDSAKKKAVEQFSKSISQTSKEAAGVSIIDGKIKIPHSVIRSHVESGITDPNELTKAIQKEIQEDYPDVSERQVRDAISNYGKTVNLNKEEIEAQIRKIKRIDRIISSMEDVQQKKRPLRSGLQRDKLDAEERALNKELKEAMKELPVDEELQAKQLKTSLDAVKSRLNNQIEDLQREIETGEKSAKAKAIPYDEEAKVLIAERDKIKAIRDEIFGDKGLSDEQKINNAIKATERAIVETNRRIEEVDLQVSKKQIPQTPKLVEVKDRLKQAKSQLQKLQEDAGIPGKRKLENAKSTAQRRIEDLQRRLKEGDFSKKKLKPVIADTELTRLRAEKLRIQEEFDKEQYKNELKNRTRIQKIKDALWELWGIPRVLMATGEASFVGVQGLKQTISHPVNAAKAFKNALQFFGSEKKTEEWLRNIKSQEWYPIAKQSKLAISEPNAKITAREELFYSGWSNLLWNMLGKAVVSPAALSSKEAYKKWQQGWNNLNPLKAFERAAVGYLDTLRVERFLDGMQILERKGKTIENNKQDYKDVADVINTMTGRGSLGKFGEQNSETLSKIFFSPRNWSAGIKTATPYTIYYLGSMTPTARKMALADLSKMVGLTTAMVMMVAAYVNYDDDKETSVEFDPRSSDFMKIKIGNTRVDPWGGMQPQIVFSSRIIADAIMKGLSMMGMKSPIGGAFKKTDGKLLPLGVPYQTKTALGLAGQQAVNKLNPTASLINNYLQTHYKGGKLVNEYGKEYSIENELSDKFNPIFWNTVSELLKDDPTALDGLLAFYAFFGGGVQTYEPKKHKN